MVRRAHGGLGRHVRARVAARLTLGLAVTLAILLGSLEIHHHSGELGALADGTLVYQAAAHPSRAHHLEAPGAGQVLHCPACLLHHHSHGDAAPADVALGAPPATGSPLAIGEPTWPAPLAHPGGSRAPPRG